jgi:hypothetical protein
MRLIDFFRKKVPLRTENFNNSEITLLPKEMRERAEYLLTIKNPRKTFSRVRGKKVFSNCYGTMFFVLGSESLERARKIAADFPEKNPNFLVDGNGPGYVSSKVTSKFFENYCEEIYKEEDILPGTLLGVFHPIRRLGGLQHSAICLGNNKIFEQYNEGGPYRVESFASIPRNLHSDFYKLT